MAGFAEPKTDDEAKRLKAFLDAGATTTLEVVKAFEAIGAADAALGKPGLLSFETTADELRQLATTTSGARTLLTFEIGGIDRDHEYFGAIFLNNDNVGAANADAQAPGFAATFGFFCQVEGPEGVIICPIDPRTPLAYQFDITDALAKVEQAGDRLRASIVLVPQPDRQPEVGALTVARAEVQVSQSTVKLG
jgi:hypothetical protein